MNTVSNSKEVLPPDVKRLVRNKLPSILTCSVEEVRPLLAQAPKLCVQLAEAFERVTQQSRAAPTDSLKKGSREWLNHTMASLPLRNVDTYKCGALSIRPTPDASLRYLLMDYMSDQKAISDKGVLNRELLCLSLYDQLSDAGKKSYEPIAGWRTDLWLSEAYVLPGDVAIAKYIHLVEQLFSNRYAALEADIRKELKLPISQPTPIHYIERLAKGAQSSVLDRLSRYIVPVPSDAGASDDGIIMVLVHVAANRVLLESACRDDLTRRATPANVLLLSALNAAGIDEVPLLESDDEVRTCLQDWFGQGGQVCKDEGWTAMSEEDIEVTLKHATYAQDMYRRTRGALSVKSEPDAFNMPGDKLCFSLALVACYYGKVAVRNELVGQTHSEYFVFPRRDQQRRNNPLSPNALELVMTLSGQIFMSNSGWRLQATEVDAYAHATSLRRGHLQSLIFDVFKKWTPPQLLAVQAAFEREVREIECELASPKLP
jgi:hypothetical protein